MIRAAVLLASSIAFVTSVQATDQPKAPVEAERMLCGGWKGPACGGDWTYAADGTFEVAHYSPGGHQLTGTWEVRWNAIPPTLVRTCTASDDPDYIGKTWEVKLVRLDADALAYQYPDQFPRGHTVRYTRSAAVLAGAKLQERELAALQGTWVPLHYEEGGKQVRESNTKHIIKGDTVTVVVNGQPQAEGKVVLDATQNPKHLDFQLSSGQTHVMIYVRAGDSVIYCGSRDVKNRPSAFASGTAKGGEYLMSWKIEK